MESITEGMDQRAAPRTGGRWPLAAVLLAALSVAATMAVEWGLGPSLLGWNTAFTAGAAAALAGMLVARRGADPAQRSHWTWWVAAAALWLAGQLCWDLFSQTGFPASPNLADVGWWGFAVLVIAGLLGVPGRTRNERAVAIVEALPLIAAAMALTSAELWSAAASSPLPVSERLSALVYPALYVSAAILTLQAMVGGSLRPVRGPGPRIVLLGIVIQAVAFISWSEQLLRGGYVMGETLVDPLWIVGLISIAAGGVLAGRRPETAVGVDEMSRHGGVLPGVMLVLLAGALIRAQFAGLPLGVRVMLAAGLFVCGATLVIRTSLLERRLRLLLALERSAREELAGREAELARLNERLREDSRRDPLTGLRNRRALIEDLPEIELDALHRGQSFAVAICDVDRFKAYNDRLGHLAGDQALRALATTVAMQLRPGDAAYRYGGEELVLVLRDAEIHEALAAAERVRAAVAATAIAHPADASGVVTVSIGVAAGESDAATLLSRADRSLYEAKSAGRNCVLGAAEQSLSRSPARRRTDAVEEPVLRHLRSLLEVTRAAVSGRGALPVLEAVGETIRSELRFQTVAVNLREGDDDDLRVVLVIGDDEARTALLDTTNPWTTWHPLLDPAHDRCGAIWLPAGTHDWSGDMTTWSPRQDRALDPDAWDADDMLLLPLRGSAGEVIGIISVDEPLSGRRPTDSELSILMAVTDHAALALERALKASGSTAAPNGDTGGEVPELRLAAAMLLAETLDLRDAGTAEHSRTVGAFARDTAAALGLAPQRVARLHAAGVLHDLGKLGIADAILHKPGALDEAEWREIRRHPEIGARILERAGLRDIAGWVRAHHERLDGRGYPGGLSEDEIPLEARILAVADAYEAMIADRPYRTGLPPEDACAELARCAGTQFDPAVVDAFTGTLRPHEPGSRRFRAAVA